ncbi:hypothetical protein F7725_024770 [Dissostichus mawsoni]|uniref:Uncharacterized protein n=1 Tax=Dissostichus mawsoni TaxID=36200 RepID=A0A7J5X984_DISMA|nr:hypothetical protein F7725_024770 [Dissostichus mawsoni]
MAKGQQRDGGFSLVKMSLDPVQVMSGQVKELKVGPSSNGDSRGSWEEKEEIDQDNVGISTKPKPVTGRRTRKVEGGVFFDGVEEYLRFQIEHENEPFTPGPAFPFVKALEAVNCRLRELYPQSDELFDIVLVTYNHAHVGIRLINTINHHSKSLVYREVLYDGGKQSHRLPEGLANQPLPVCRRRQGIAAATMFTSEKVTEVSESQLRVAFDGDAVLFSDESERIFKAHGLDKFFEHERDNEDTLLDHKKFYAKGQRLDCPIRTYLVTARSAASSGIRALKTLRAWGLEIDEALFLAGAPKGPMLEKIRPHIYFDDQMFHVEGAAEMGTVAALFPTALHRNITPNRTSV